MKAFKDAVETFPSLDPEGTGCRSIGLRDVEGVIPDVGLVAEARRVDDVGKVGGRGGKDPSDGGSS